MIKNGKRENYSPKAIHIDNVSVYYGQTPAITGVCLDVDEGEYLGIIGPNGGGKSTLLKVILGLIPPSSGKVEIFGEKPGKGGGRVGYVPQISLLDKAFPITVFEVVRTGMLKPGLTPFFGYSREDEERTSELLQKTGLYDLKERRISELSGGEFQRMLIARALAVEPKLLLLDEPTANVDVSSLERIYKLLEELNKNITIVLVTHDLLAVSSQVKMLACLNGRMVYHGEPELDQNIVNSLYGCPVDLIAHGVPHRVLKEHGEGEHTC